MDDEHTYFSTYNLSSMDDFLKSIYQMMVDGGNCDQLLSWLSNCVQAVAIGTKRVGGREGGS